VSAETIVAGPSSYFGSKGSVSFAGAASGRWFVWVVFGRADGSLTDDVAGTNVVPDAGGVVGWYDQYGDYQGAPGPVVGVQLTEADHLYTPGYGFPDVGVTAPWDCRFYFGVRRAGVPEAYATPWGAVPAAGAAVAPEGLLGLGNALLDYATCRCGDPVDDATGNFSETETDLTAGAGGTGGFPLAATRTYNALAADADTGFGHGWSHGYGWSVDATTRPGVATVVAGNGARTDFYADGSGGFKAAAAVKARLEAVTGGGYRLTRQPHQVLTFDDTGRLISQSTVAGVSTTLTYAAGRLATVTDAAGRRLTYSYGGDGHVSSLTGPGGRTVSYHYDTAGDLRSVDDATGHTMSMTYDTGHRMLTRTDPRSGVLRNTYDTAGRVSAQEDAGHHTTGWDYQGGAAGASTTTVTDADGNRSVYKFQNNVVVARTVAAGTAREATTRFEYGTFLQPTKVTDAKGNVTVSVYDADGNLTSRTDAKNQVTSYTYDPDGAVATRTDPGGGTTQYDYYPNGLLHTVTDPLSEVTQFSYTALGEVDQVTSAAGRVTDYDYDPAGNRTGETSGEGNRTSYTYDASGWVTSSTSPRGNLTGADPEKYTTHYTRDGLGRVLTSTDPRDTVTANSYDGNGNLTHRTLTDAAGQVLSDITTGYDAQNRPVTTSDAGRTVATTTYDPVGNLLTSTDGVGATTSYTYDPANRRATMTTARGNAPGATPADFTWSYGYDPDGLQTSVTTPSGTGRTTFGYDNDGRLRTTVDPLGNLTGGTPADYTTTFGYDADGNQTTQKNQLGATTTTSYDPAGHPLAVSTARGSVTTRTYDGAGRVLTVTDPAGNTTGYGYDKYGDPVRRTDANGHDTTYTYNPRHQLLEVTDQLGRRRTYGYDAEGNRTTQVTARGTGAGASAATTAAWTLTESYDNRNLRTEITNTADPSVHATFGYDDDGRLGTFTDTTGTTNLTWDAADQLKNLTGPDGTYAYSYAPFGAVSQRTLPSDGAIDYTFNADGRVDSLTANTQTSTFGYDTNGNLSTVTYPTGTGLVETRGYNRAGDITKVVNKKGSTLLSQFDYTLDGDGNPTTVKTTRGTTVTSNAYTYDAAQRLKSYCPGAATCTGATQTVTYTYDPLGARTQEDRVGVSAPGTVLSKYDPAGQLTSRTAQDGTVTSYTHDADGNLTTGGRTWDALGRLTSIGTTTATTIKYNALNLRRTLKTGTANPTSYSWDINNPMPMIAVTTQPDNTKWSNRYDPTGWSLSTTHLGQNYGYTQLMHDALGNVTDATGGLNGTPEWKQSYTPWGVRTNTSLTTTAEDTPFGFTDAYLESATNENHLRARDYNPSLYAFTAPDPATADPNDPYTSPYLYANNQPTLLTDPSGQCPNCIIGAIGAVAGAGIGAGSYALTHHGQITTTGLLGATAAGAVGGAISGATLGLGTGLGATLATGALANTAATTTESLLTGHGIPSPCDLTTSALTGAALGGLGYGTAKALTAIPRQLHPTLTAHAHTDDLAAKAGTAGADDVLNGVRLRAQMTGQEIAGGHAFEKHILDLGEFPGIRTRAQFASHIEDVVLNGEMRTLGGGRTAFWRDGSVVIRNPRAHDGGTAFQPTDGYDYFLNQLH
jgi:RHS repeat-associated protein